MTRLPRWRAHRVSPVNPKSTAARRIWALTRRALWCTLLDMKPKLFYQSLGRSWAVGIESDDPKQIVSQDYSWYNHGAYNGELKYMSERFAYIWSTEEDLKSYLYNSSLAYFLGKYGNSLREKVRRYARLLARLRFNTMTEEPFIKHSSCGLYSMAMRPVGSGGISKQTGYWAGDDEEEWKQNSTQYYMGVSDGK